MKKLNLLILFILSLNLTVHAQAPIGNNLYFNGIDEYVDAGHDPKFRPGYITVEMWVNPLTLNEGDELLRNYSDNNSKGYIFTFNNNKLRFIIGENNPGSPSVTLTEGWQHIAGTWDGTWLTIYRNSVFVERKKPKNDWFYGLGTIISGPIDYGTVANPSHLRIGGGAGWLSEGRIDEVRIWNKALTQTQISAMMNYEIMNGVGGSVQLVGTSTIISGLNFCTNLNVYYQFNETNSSSKDVLDSSCKLPKLNGGYVNIDDSNIGDSDANRRYVSDTNGDWDIAASWDHNEVPPVSNTNDVVVINNIITTSGNTKTIKDCFVNSGGELSINTDGSLTINGDLTNDGTLTVKSDVSGTGSLITNGTVASGTLEIQRYISETTAWHLVSSPMTAGLSGVYHGHYLNDYDDKLGDFDPIILTDKDMVVGDGYVAKWKNEFGTDVNPMKFTEAHGLPNNADVPINIYKTVEEGGPGGPANTYFNLPRGFNLIGNPYPSNLDLEEVLTENSSLGIDATFYYYEEGTHSDGSKGNKGGWKVYNANTGTPDESNRYVSIGQGFGTVITGNSGDLLLNIPKSARTHKIGSGGFHKKSTTKNNYFELVSSTNDNWDKIYFRFNENSTSNFDGLYDAYKLNSFETNPTPFFVSSDNKRLAICEMPESESVDLGFNMEVSGEVTFSLSNVQDFTEIVLEDKITGDFVDLLKNKYTFTYSNEEAETGRFTLHFKQGALSEIEELDKLSIYSNASTLYIKSDNRLNNVNVSIYSISGQEVISKYYNTLTNEEINTELKGVYILNLTSDKGNYTTKLILN